MAQIERMAVALPAEMAATVRLAVESGDYVSSSEVFRDAIRDWKYKCHLQEQKLKNIIAGVQQGLADLKAGNTKPAEDVLTRLKKKYQDMLYLMACIFTVQAENDLESIADYIALDNPARALSFVGEIRERCHRITNAL